MFDLGVAPAVLVFVGGALYTLGALTYALRRPNPARRRSATTRSSTCS
jgi:predicted membrane channel-forming protein YqfA (hemolysin III family)